MISADLILTQQRPKVSDFGSARSVGENSYSTRFIKNISQRKTKKFKYKQYIPYCYIDDKTKKARSEAVKIAKSEGHNHIDLQS